jgi:hypothetical protein
MVVEMISKRNGLKEDIERVLAELLKAIDFDIETLLEADPEEIETLIFEAVLSVIDQEEVPFIDWIRMVEEEEVDELRNEKGEFIVN